MRRTKETYSHGRKWKRKTFITFWNTEASGTNQSVSFQSRFMALMAFASWHSSKSLFPYDQYDIWKSIYAIAAITLNQRFNKFSTQWLNIVQFQFKAVSVYRYFFRSPAWLLNFVQFVVIRQPGRDRNDQGIMAYVSVKSKLQHLPPGQPPGHLTFLFKFSPNRAKMPFKCPTQGSIQVIKFPHPGDISQAHNDRRTAETPSVVEQNLYKYSK